MGSNDQREVGTVTLRQLQVHGKRLENLLMVLI